MSNTPSQDEKTEPTSKAVVVAASAGIFTLVGVILFLVLFAIGLLAGPAWASLEARNGAVGASAIIAVVVACIVAFGVVWQFALNDLRSHRD